MVYCIKLKKLLDFIGFGFGYRPCIWWHLWLESGMISVRKNSITSVLQKKSFRRKCNVTETVRKNPFLSDGTSLWLETKYHILSTPYKLKWWHRKNLEFLSQKPLVLKVLTVETLKRANNSCSNHMLPQLTQKVSCPFPMTIGKVSKKASNHPTKEPTDPSQVSKSFVMSSFCLLNIFKKKKKKGKEDGRKKTFQIFKEQLIRVWGRDILSFEKAFSFN